MRISGRNLPSTSHCLCADNNILFEIYRKATTGDQYLKVYDSDPIPQTVDPAYPAFKLTGQQLCNSNKELPLQIRFYNLINMERTLLCSTTTTLNEMIDKREYALHHAITNQAAGNFVIQQIVVTEKPGFLEYLRSGWQINLCVAIDYTASNGEYS